MTSWAPAVPQRPSWATWETEARPGGVWGPEKKGVHLPGRGSSLLALAGLETLGTPSHVGVWHTLAHTHPSPLTTYALRTKRACVKCEKRSSVSWSMEQRGRRHS